MTRSIRSATLTVAAVFTFAYLAYETTHLRRVTASGTDPSSTIVQTRLEADPLLPTSPHFSNAVLQQGSGSSHYTLTPDSQFGTGGRVTTDFGSRYDDARASALQPDGKMILAGKADAHDGILCRATGGGKFSTTCTRCYTGASISDANFALTRYQGDGSPDTTFGAGGRVLTDFGGEDEVNAVTIQSDGKIVAAGLTFTVAFFGGPSQNVKFALARYNSDGSLDASFGGTGKVITEFGTSSQATAVVAQSDGKIVAAGYTGGAQGKSFALARYNKDGSLDATFGVGGKIVTPLNGWDEVAALLLQPGNKIIAAGSAATLFGVNSVLALVRYNADGTLDTTFGSNGKTLTSFSVDSGSLPVTSGARAIVQQSDGKLLAGGYARTTVGKGFLLARYSSDGILDTGFGDRGAAITNLRAGGSEISSVSLQPNGEIVAAGGTLMARYDSDGHLDSTFGSSGVETIGIDNSESRFVLMLSNTKVLLSGIVTVPIADVLFTDVSCGDRQFLLARYDIALDPPPTPTPTPTPGDGGPTPTPTPKPSPPPGCDFSYPGWLRSAVERDPSAILFDNSGDDVKAHIFVEYPVPHLAPNGPGEFPAWVPFIGGKFGMLETFGKVEGNVSNNKGGGDFKIYGQTGFAAGTNNNITGKVSGGGAFSFRCNDGLGLRSGNFNLDIENSIKKEVGLVDAIPPVKRLSGFPGADKVLNWINKKATLAVKISPALHFGATFKEDHGDLRFDEATGSLGVNLRAIFQIRPFRGVSVSAWVGGGGGGTVGVPNPPPFLRKLKINFEAGAKVDVDFIFHKEFRAVYGCTWTPGGSASCGKQESSSSSLRGLYGGSLLASFGESRGHNNTFSFVNASADLAPTPRAPESDRTVSVFRPDYKRFGPYAVFHRHNVERVRAVSAAQPLAPQASTVLSNIFPGASPTVIEVGGGRLLLWEHQDTALPVLQSTNIAWSFDDGGGPSAPSLVAADTRVELSPVAGVDAKGKVVAAWLRVKDAAFSAPVSRAEDLSRFYTRLEVVTAVFDPATRKWGAVVQLTYDARMDTDLRLSSDGSGRPLLTWLSSPNAEFMSSAASPSTLKYSVWDGAKWSPPAVIADGLIGVGTHAAAMRGDRAFIILPRATGADGTGAGVLDLYTWDGSAWSGPSTFASGDVDNRLPEVVYDAVGKGHVVWVRGDDLVHATVGNPVPQVIRPGSTSLAFYDTKLLTNPQGNLTLLFPQVTDAGPANISAIIYDTSAGTWGTDHLLHQDPSMAHDFSGYYGRDGALHLVYLATEIRRVSRSVVLDGVTETIENIPEEGRTDLRLLIHRLVTDLAVADADFTIAPRASQTGGTDTARLVVHNPGDFAVNGFTVRLYQGDPDAGGALLNTLRITETLLAGDHRAVLMPFTMPRDAGGKLVAVVMPSDSVAEVTRANNRATLYLGRDTVPPILIVPANITKEATIYAGVPVAYSSSATDERDANPAVSCTPASGATFGLGFTTVTCTATDTSGNVARASFIVRVVDTKPPNLNLPTGITKNATGPAGAQVTYTASATDVADPAPKLTCSPASGSTFSIGTTIVICTVSDTSGNSVPGSFPITVRGAAEQLADLILMVERFNRPKSSGKKFEHELNKASDALRSGNLRKACQELDKFIKAVLKASGGKLTSAEATQLLAAATQVRVVMSCQ